MAFEPLKDVTKAATLCAYCPKMCKFACPVSEAIPSETVTPWGKMSLVYLAERGDVSPGDPDLARAFEACTGCGACVEQCAHGNPVAETLFFARGAVKSDRSRMLRKNFEETGDAKRRDLAGAIAKLPRDHEAPVAYFPGCRRLADDDGRMHKDLAALERALGAEIPAVDLPPKRMCCGYPLYADGQIDLLVQHLSAMNEALSRHEIIVTPDPGCAYVLDVVRRELAVKRKEGPRVLPLVEVLAHHADKFAGASPGTEVRYHDACYLGRRGRSFDAPRALIEAATGMPPAEFAACRDHADCSGAGGLFPTSDPEGARAMAAKRLNDPLAAKRPLPVVTACPSARRNLERGGGHAIDLIDLVMGDGGVPHDDADVTLRQGTRGTRGGGEHV